MSSNYRRVPQREGSNAGANPEGGSASEGVRSRSERLQDKVVALGWICMAIFVARWTNFFTTIWSSDVPNRTLLRIATLGFGIVTALILYLTVYLPRFKGLVDSSAWGVYCPRVIPTMAGVSVVSYLILLRSIWPVWGFLSPLVFGVQCMGVIMSLHFVPTMGMF